MGAYNAIVIGAGHNGLILATYLAKRGQRVLLLEAATKPGGLAAEREFHPGFKSNVAHTISHFSQQVVHDLDLAAHGFKSGATRLATVGLNSEGRHVVVADGAVQGTDDADLGAYQRYDKDMRRFAEVLRPFWGKTMPGIGARSFRELLTFAHVGARIRFSGKDTMRELLRVASLPARDLMDEYFTSDLLKATLAWDGLIGAKMAPRSPNSAVLAMLYRLSEPTASGHSLPAGGITSLVRALQSAAEAAGVDIRYEAEVERVLIAEDQNGLTASGVQLANGQKLEADRVISAVDPKRTFLDLVGVRHLDIGFTNQIRRLRCDGYVAKLHLALDELPTFTGLDTPDGRMIIAPELDAIEFAYDHAKYGELPQQPVLEALIPSLHDPDLAPSGKHVLSAHVMYVPYSLKGGWTQGARDEISRRAIAALAAYAPGIESLILSHELLTPADLERDFRVTGGHWHHTEFAMDQLLMMRPTYGAAQYGTPIPGLYLCSAGSHPGGDLSGLAGRNAALEILR